MINLFIRFIIFFCFTGLLYSEEDFEIPRYEELEAIESLQSQAKVESMSLAELEEYATNNNPLYLAAKKDLGIARSGVLSAAIRHNPILYFEQQFIQSKAGYSAPLIGSLGGDAGGGVESAPKISYEFDLSG
ncbi:MAG: hypothetical protein KDK45_24585, partial [Leptospiraceae bacterium]|nr:hypothetical protein [Leptospiraceae bacterium]